MLPVEKPMHKAGFGGYTGCKGVAFLFDFFGVVEAVCTSRFCFLWYQGVLYW